MGIGVGTEGTRVQEAVGDGQKAEGAGKEGEGLGMRREEGRAGGRGHKAGAQAAVLLQPPCARSGAKPNPATRARGSRGGALRCLLSPAAEQSQELHSAPCGGRAVPLQHRWQSGGEAAADGTPGGRRWPCR